jgi:cell division protease FtsH
MNNERREIKPGPPPRKGKGMLIFLMIAFVVVMLLYWGKSMATKAKTLEVSYAEFLHRLENGDIAEVFQEGNEFTGLLSKRYVKDGKEYTKIHTEFPSSYFEGSEGYEKIRSLIDHSKYHYSAPNLFFQQVILAYLPWIILIVLFWFLLFRMSRATGGPTDVLRFGKSRARFANVDKCKVTFDDVAGIDEAKEEVQEIIEYLRDPKRFQKLGGRIPRGILLVGPPGSGKTLLAKAVAGEARVPFLSISGSDFVEMFVGVGASRVRDLFEQARKNSPCVVFLDEIDAVGRRRGSGLGGGHDEREQTLNAILVEMDGFDRDEGIIIMAATNRPDVLDPALLRPGRFDREIVLDLPDIKGREEILKVHAKKVKLAKGCDLKVLARTTPMFSGAELEAIINEAAIIAVMKKKDSIELGDLEEARDKIKWGRQKRAKVMDEEDKKVTAYHESGHAIIAELLPEIEPLHKVTIIPRGVSLGATMTMPEKDRYHMQKRYLLGIVTMLFGGRVAEEMFCSDISAGAKDDIRRATELVRMMVCEWGMSESMGPISYSETEEHIFLGREIARTRNHSEQIALEIDREVRKIIEGCYQRAKQLIGSNSASLVNITKALLKYETLTGEDVKAIMSGEDIEALKREVEPSPKAEPEHPTPDWKPLPGQKPLPGSAEA